MPVTNTAIYHAYGIIHPMIHPSVMIRRSMLPDANKIYAMKWDVNDDYYTFFSLLQYGQFANIPEYLLKYRIHGNNLSLKNPKEKFMNSIHIRIEAMKKLHYIISIDALVIMWLQYALISLIPERLIVPLYMAIRGMDSPIKAFKKLVHAHLSFHPKHLAKIRYTVHG